MEENSSEGGRDSKLRDGNPSRKRSHDSKHRTSSERTRIKDATEKKHKSSSREKGGKHSGPAIVVSTVRVTHSESDCKPLQESKITSSEKLACHVTVMSGNSEGDVGTEVFDSNEDALPSACRNYTDINNNIFDVSEELEGKRSIDSAVHQNVTSERSAPTKKRNHTDVSKVKKDQKKHKFKCSEEGICEMGKNSGKPMKTTKDTRLTKSGSRSESQPEKDKSHKSKSKKKEAKSKDASDAVKEEMDECPGQDYGELREDTQAEVKTLKKAQNIKGESFEEVLNNHMQKRKKDKGRSMKMGTEDEKNLRKGQEEGKSSRKNKRKKDNADADEPKNKKKKIGKESAIQKSDKKDDKKDEARLWKWWEEGQSLDGRKWKTLEHKGPLFPPEYESLPPNVSFHYNGKQVRLSAATEEVATFYGKMLDHEYTTKETFQKNFFTDWRKEMTRDERDMIQDLSKCDFGKIHKYFVDKAEERKALSKEEKKALKEEASKQTEEYGYCFLDGHHEKIGNFRVEPPGLFRGRGEHPKMGKLKRRILPEDITINCSKESNIPVPPKGHRWKKVQHDNTVTWLASWVENIQGSIKYIMLNPSSKLKGEKDWQKYEIARELKLKVDMIRRQYQTDWKSREMKIRQKGVAVYFIDKLALRAGNEKEEGESADTVGCCSLRVEHITLHEELDGQTWVVEFDFLGKDSIRYYNKVPVEKRVFKNVKLFMENKNPEDDLFDRINTGYLNKTLNESMTGLSAKVFRTFNASTTLQEQLNKLTHGRSMGNAEIRKLIESSADMSVDEKILSYNRANRAVAILCNHQRAAPKTFEKSMQLIQEKIAQKRKLLDDAKKELKQAKTQDSDRSTDKSRKMVENKEKAVKRLKEQLKKLLLQMTDREENKVIALGTSKLNYLDPRISVAWCKKFNVPVEKIYNKTQRDKFAWAIDMTEEDYQF